MASGCHPTTIGGSAQFAVRRIFGSMGQLEQLLKDAVGLRAASTNRSASKTFIAFGEFRDGPGGAPEIEHLVVLPARVATLALTTREREVVQAMATGATNREIAAMLCVSAPTVKKHLEHVYSKLGVHSRNAAVAHLLLEDLPDFHRAP